MTELLPPPPVAPAPPAPLTMAFGPLSISYDDRVLTPRPWTQLQARWAAEILEEAPPGPVLELCSGAGHIGLLAVHGTDRRLVCVDVDPVACGFARRNADAAGRGGLVEVRNLAVDDFASDEQYPLIVADPPWVLSEHLACFPADPALAIDGGDDGLALARRCVAVIDQQLHPDGAALLQLGSVVQLETLTGELPSGLVAADVRAEPGRGLVVRLVRPGR